MDGEEVLGSLGIGVKVGAVILKEFKVRFWSSFLVLCGVGE